jgi:hypothetical protein
MTGRSDLPDEEDIGRIDVPDYRAHPNSRPAENPTQIPQDEILGKVAAPDRQPVELSEKIGTVVDPNSDPVFRLVDQEVQNHIANRKLRENYSEKAYQIAKGGICFWIISLSATGIIFGITGKQMLSDKILIAITTGATVNTLAAFLGVIRGLFPSNAKEKIEEMLKKVTKQSPPRSSSSTRRK